VDTKFYNDAPDILGPSGWSLLHVTLLAPGIVRRCFRFWEVCALLLRVFSLVTRLRTGRAKVPIPAGTSDFSFLQNSQTNSMAYSASYSLVTEVLSNG
jgi:hypothetical protein